jgi:hypothetical protein
MCIRDSSTLTAPTLPGAGGGDAVGFQLRSRPDALAPWNDWGSPQSMEYEKHYLTRPQTFEIRYVYAALPPQQGG